MGYLGNATKYQSFPIDLFNGTGSQTIFTLSNKPGVAAALLITVAGVKLKANIDYTVSGNTLTFTSAPASGTNNIEVVYLGIKADVGTPADGAITPVKLSTGAPTWDSAGKLTLSTPPNLGSTVPAVEAWQNVNQSFSATTWTRVNLQSKQLDNTNAFDNVTNYRFQPQVPGWYMVSASLTASVTCAVAIYKNSGVYKTVAGLPAVFSTLSTPIWLNGTSDYVEMWGYLNSASTSTSGQTSTTFSACLLQRTA